jgi:quercetin dioxygenase-like cupin family protein
MPGGVARHYLPVVSLLVPASTQNAYDEQGFRYRIHLSGQDTSGSFALIEQAGRGGAGSPLHRHTREAETFFVLNGDLDAWSDGAHMIVSAGDTLHLPAGSEHAFRVRSDTIRFLLLITPAGLEQFFINQGKHSNADTPLPPLPGPPPPEAMERLVQTLSQYGVAITGPAPTA